MENGNFNCRYRKKIIVVDQAVNRSYLDITRSHGVFKHARMTSKDFESSIFLVGDAREGGYILDFLSNTSLASEITKRIADALNPAFEKAKEEGLTRMENLDSDIDVQKSKLVKNLILPKIFDKELLYPDPKIVRQYGDKSILKEIDQILAIIRKEELGENYFSLSLDVDGKKEYSFNRDKSNNFHSIITKKSIGNPMIYKGTLRMLDSGTKIGKFINSSTKKTHNLRFRSENDIFSIREFLGGKQDFEFYGSPVIEYGSYDLYAGDIYFLMLRKE